jgi:hypothetical protein
VPDQTLLVPCWCPVCNGMMKGKSTYTWYDYACCVDCYIWFLDGRPATIEKWKAGWRPDDAQLKHYLEMKN